MFSSFYNQSCCFICIHRSIYILLPSFERQTFISIKLCSFIISIIGDIHKKLNSVEIQTYLGYAFIELDHEIPHADEENFLGKVRCKLSIESLIFYGLSLSSSILDSIKPYEYIFLLLLELRTIWSRRTVLL